MGFSYSDISRSMIAHAEQYGELPVHWRRMDVRQLIDLEDQVDLVIDTLRAHAHALNKLDALSDLVEIEGKLGVWMRRSLEIQRMVDSIEPHNNGRY